MTGVKPGRQGGRVSRADRALVDRGLIASRSLAQRLIDDGAVHLIVGDKSSPVLRASQPVDVDDTLEVRESPESRFVSRAGAKLESALIDAGIDCTGYLVLDCGMSTGGFADCLLRRGAEGVVGIEVGHGQLSAQLSGHPAIRCFERTHIRSVDAAWRVANGYPPFRMIVSDLSFISSIGLLAGLSAIAAPDAHLLMLVKPQFELGPKALDARGVVRRDADIAGLRVDALRRARDAGWVGAQWLPARPAGGDGNHEFFLVARTGSDHAADAVAVTPATPGCLDPVLD